MGVDDSFPFREGSDCLRPPFSRWKEACRGLNMKVPVLGVSPVTVVKFPNKSFKEKRVSSGSESTMKGKSSRSSKWLVTLHRK